MLDLMNLIYYHSWDTGYCHPNIKCRTTWFDIGRCGSNNFCYWRSTSKRDLKYSSTSVNTYGQPIHSSRICCLPWKVQSVLVNNQHKRLHKTSSCNFWSPVLKQTKQDASRKQCPSLPISCTLSVLLALCCNDSLWQFCISGQSVFGPWTFL